jgi:MFS family permease
VLAAGTAAQASYSAIWFGVAVLAPALRDEYRLSLAQVGVLIASSLAGSVLSLIPWGIAADRFGERAVLGVGLAGSGAALLVAAHASSFGALAALLALAGLSGASVQSASGRAVMHWFDASERGLALGIRQTAVPIGGFAASLTLPHIVAAGGTAWSLRALGFSCFVTAVVGECELLLDQRHLEARTLAAMLGEAKEAAARFSQEENVDVAWERIWQIEPILFDEGLVELADEAVREVSGTSHRLPSGPLHDAAEVSRAGVPTVMLFVQSLRGLSHAKEEDTKPEHLELSVRALDALASKTLERLAAQA